MLLLHGNFLIMIKFQTLTNDEVCSEYTKTLADFSLHKFSESTREKLANKIFDLQEEIKKRGIKNDG